MTDHWHKRIFQLTFGFLLFRFLIAAILPLSPDESYYWLWAKNLDWSYFDHPPMVAWWIAISTCLFGESELAVRIFAPFSLFILSWIAAYFARITANGKAALSLVLAIQVIPLFNLGGIIITPDTPLIFFWSLALFFLYSISGKLNHKRGIVLGVFVGLGLLSKYSMILFPLITLIYLLKTRPWKKWCLPLTTSCITAALIFLPAILWNQQHNWASFVFQLKHGTSGTGSLAQNIVNFIVSQLGLFSLGFCYLLILWGLHTQDMLSRKQQTKLFALLPLLFFFAFAVFSHSEAGWTAIAYPATIWGIWLMVFFTKELPRKLWNISLAIAMLFSTLMYIWALNGFGQNNILSQAEKLETETNALLENLPEDMTRLPLVGQSYQIASMWSYYMKEEPYRISTLKSEGGRLSQFDYWKANRRLDKGFIWIVPANKAVTPDLSRLPKMDCAYAKELWPNRLKHEKAYDFLICKPQ